jgi:hypothetical protein
MAVIPVVAVVVMLAKASIQTLSRVRAERRDDLPPLNTARDS